MKVGDLKIGELYKIKDNSRLTPFRKKLLGFQVIKWGKTIDKDALIPTISIFQYLGKKRITNTLTREEKKIYYTQHTFLLLLDSKEYIISGYSARNLEPLKQPTK